MLVDTVSLLQEVKRLNGFLTPSCVSLAATIFQSRVELSGKTSWRDEGVKHHQLDLWDPSLILGYSVQTRAVIILEAKLYIPSTYYKKYDFDLAILYLFCS